MSVNRTPELLADLRKWATEFTHDIGLGMRSIRAQWDIEGHEEPLTLYANRTGTFVVEPGEKPVPAIEWLDA